MYLTESVATEKRLSLDNVDSVALNAKYSVIYRTVEEYNELYRIFIDDGFVLTKQYLPFASESAKKQTDKIITILRR